MSNKTNNEFVGILMVLASAILFSLKSIIIKTAFAQQIHAHELIFWRLVLAAPVAWVVWFFLDSNRELKLNATEKITVLYMGAVGIFVSLFGSYSALQYIDASVSVIVIFTYPAIVTVLSFIFFKEKIGMQKMGAIIVTYIGLLMVVKLVHGFSPTIDYRGVLLAGMAALAFSSHQILAQKILKNISPFKLAAFTATVAALTVCIAYPPERLHFDHKLLLTAGILATMAGILPFILLLFGIKRLGASRASLISIISPVSTAFWAYVVLGERLSAIQIKGMGLVLFGVALLKLHLPVRTKCRTIKLEQKGQNYSKSKNFT